MRSLINGVLSLALFVSSSAAFADDHGSEVVTSQHSFSLTKIAGNLENPWGLDWLPSGQIIVTERPGRLTLISTDGRTKTPVRGLPKITSEFRDGLLDVAVSPNFVSDQTIFFTYSQKEGDNRWLEVASARLSDSTLQDVKVIFSSGVKVQKDQGFGSRIRFDDQGFMVISVGDHAVAANAQNPMNPLGSVIRIGRNGSPAVQYPGDDKAPAIFAYGFKNPQGLAIDPRDGTIWATDHGGKGGGELNRVETGANYGWPTRTFSGGDAPRATVEGDFIDPVFTWGAAPTIALSGLEIYTGEDFPSWEGDLFAGSLKQEALIRMMLDDAGSVVGTEYVIYEDIGRIREVKQGPDGRLYVLNDDPEGGIYRIDPISRVPS